MAAENPRKIGKLALIRKKAASEWKSCALIVPNLEAAYRNGFAPDQIEVFSFLPNEDWTLRRAELNRLHDFHPDRTVVLDHEPFGTWFLAAAADSKLFEESQNYFIHCFGDFSLSAARWWDLRGWLSRHRLTLIGASHRASDMLSRFLKDGTSVPPVVPFPIDSQVFFYDAETARGRRKALVKNDREFLILYSGRISLQKNITVLLDAIGSWRPKIDRPIHLLLAGGVDDFGADYFGINLPSGTYTRMLTEKIRVLSGNKNIRISLLGPLDSTELSATYQAADALMSLSLHHDEDYGMAPAEALCCGTRTLLSDWGGFFSFAQYANPDPRKACHLLPLRRDPAEGWSFDRKAILTELDAVLSAPWTEKDRRQLSDGVIRQLSIPAIGHLVKEILADPPGFFPGFSSRLWEVSRQGWNCRFSAGTPQMNPLYDELYSTYMGASR